MIPLLEFRQLFLLRRAVFVALFVPLLALSGCAGIDLPGMRSAEPSESLADSKADAGKYADAARMYDVLAAAETGPAADRLHLLAALNWLDAGEADPAAASFNRVPRYDVDPSLKTLWSLTEAALKTAAGDPTSALARLDNIANGEFSTAERIRYQAIRAQVHFAQGDVAQAVDLLVHREIWLESEGAVIANHQMIWDGLRASTQENLTAGVEATENRTVAGWIDLVLVTNPVRDSETRLQAAASSWGRRYPGHPAHANFLPALLGEQPALRTGAPERLALMLPLGGRQQSAANAIRDGFVAAYIADAAAFNAPTVRVYDTSPYGAILAYERAFSDGADVVIGPLRKTAVQEMALVEHLPVPLLALNRLPDDEYGPTGFYQFALAPEDEAISAARRAVALNERRAVALVPSGDWGNRILTNFRTGLESAGGQLLDYEYYDAAETDFSQQIQRVMQISASVARRNRVRNLVEQPLQYEPRRRQDIDFVFIAARPDNARALKPQLRFHYAGDLPVYATSAVFAEDGRSNRDLRGIRFPEIPWLIDTENQVEPSAETFSRFWRTEPQIARLYAMGIDAYRLVKAIFIDGTEAPLPGATGLLTVNHDGVVHRELSWAEFSDGSIVRMPDVEPALPGGEESADEVWPEVSGSN